MANDKVKDFDLYFNGSIKVFENGAQVLERPIIAYVPAPNDIFHTVQQGDTLRSIALKYYTKMAADKAAMYWKYIADANKVFNPLDITGYIGRDIIVPDFNSIKLIE